MIIAGNQLVLIVGKKRSGKSILAEWLFSRMKATKKVIINPKNEQRLAQLYPQLYARAPTSWTGVANVIPEPQASKRKYDAAIAGAYQAGNVLILFDEFGLIVGVTDYPQTVQAIWQAGSGRGVGGIAVSQRARYLPGFVRSETDHYFSFYLALKSDRDALEEGTGVDWSEAADLDPARHEFLHYGPGMPAPERQAPLKGIKLANLYNSGGVDSGSGTKSSVLRGDRRGERRNPSEDGGAPATTDTHGSGRAGDGVLRRRRVAGQRGMEREK